MPNTLPPMMVQLSLNMGWAILNAAGLSFIGLGVRPPTAEWGLMISEGQSFIFSAWWLAVFPGLALVLLALGFSLLADGLAEWLGVQR
jgi:peptide/nickel transport system permease protein